MSEITVGSFVAHRNLPNLGVGKVFCFGHTYACIGFIDDAGTRRVMRLVKSFVAPRPAGMTYPQFDGWKVETTPDCYQVVAVSGTGKSKTPRKVTPPELTIDQAFERFLAHYPDGFAGEAYQQAERAWKVQQGALWHEQFPPGTLRTLATTDPLEAGAAVMKVLQTPDATLLATRGELPMMTWALTKGTPEAFLLALADVVDSPEPKAEQFTALVDALEAMPVLKPGTKLLAWPTLTVLPFLARPDQYLFVKPQATKDAARKLGVDLAYDSRPSWGTYQRMLAWGHDLLRFLGPHGAQDMIDVQSFILTIAKPTA